MILQILNISKQSGVKDIIVSKKYVSLASKIFFILIASSMSAVLVYSCFREQIPHYYSFIDEVAGIKDKRNKFFKEFKEKRKMSI